MYAWYYCQRLAKYTAFVSAFLHTTYQMLLQSDSVTHGLKFRYQMQIHQLALVIRARNPATGFLAHSSITMVRFES